MGRVSERWVYTRTLRNVLSKRWTTKGARPKGGSTLVLEELCGGHPRRWSGHAILDCKGARAFHMEKADRQSCCLDLCPCPLPALLQHIVVPRSGCPPCLLQGSNLSTLTFFLTYQQPPRRCERVFCKYALDGRAKAVTRSPPVFTCMPGLHEGQSRWVIRTMLRYLTLGHVYLDLQ